MLQKVAEFLASRSEEILADATAHVTRAHLPHYEQAGVTVAAERLRALYALVVRCASERHLAPALAYAVHLAEERHAAGFDLGEVQTVINVLEEAIWRAVLAAVPPAEQGETLGVVGTILGATKDKLACTYVSLATQKPTRSLDLGALFRGAGEGEAPAS